MNKETIFELAKQYGEQAYSDDCGFFPDGGSRLAEARLEAALDALISERDTKDRQVARLYEALDTIARVSNDPAIVTCAKRALMPN